MSKNSVFVIAIVTLFGLATADIMNFGACPTGIEVAPDFQVEKYMGVWHEQYRYPLIYEDGNRCNGAVYTLESNGNVIVNNTAINLESDLLVDMSGEGNFMENAKMIVEYPVASFIKAESNYWVLDTDYTTYSCVYSCQKFPLSHITHAWIYTREQHPSEEVIQICRDVFTRNNVSLEPFEKTIITNC